MKGRRLIGSMFLVAVGIVLGGCAHGTGIEFAGFGSSLESDDLGRGDGGGAKLELNPLDGCFNLPKLRGRDPLSPSLGKGLSGSGESPL